MRRILTLAALLTALAPSAAVGDVSPSVTPSVTPGPSPIPAPWTVDDVLAQERVGAVDISPDGKRAVWVKQRPDKEKDARASNLYMSWLSEDREVALTRGRDSDASPRWSADGRWIAFLSDRRTKAPSEKDDKEEGGNQIWLIDPEGGEPWPITRAEKGVTGFEWLDPGRLVYAARDGATRRERRLGERKDDTIVVEDREHFVPIRLFTTDTKGENVTRLTDNDDQIEEFAPSRDGRHIVTRHIVTPHWEAERNPKPKFFLYDLKTEIDGLPSRTEIFEDPLFFPYAFIWSLDGAGFYAVRTVASDPEWDGAGVPVLYFYDLMKKAPMEVPLDWPNGLGENVAYDVVEGGFLALLAEGASHRFARYRRDADAWRREWITGQHAEKVQRFKAAPDGTTLVFQHSTASTPPRWYAAALRGALLADPRPIIKVNSFVGGKVNARAEVITWKGALDDPIEGILYYPLAYQEGKRYPLVVTIHGGPAGADLDAFDESYTGYPNIMAAKGAFTLMPNYHGSSNYGRKFVESIKGHYYEYEVPDILKGVDHLIARGLVDPDRLGVMGWSNGGILTIALITETDRFKAAAPGAGDVNWASDFGNCSFGPQFDISYLGAAPWQNPGLYVEKSPVFRMEKVTTPTIIFFGTEDRSVPTEQGWQHFRAMNMIGKAPVKFLLFPDEPHVFGKITHQRRKMEEEIAWFDRYLFGAAGPVNEALQEGSPLDLALKARGIGRAGGFYGVRRGGVLAPETVAWEGRGIGRFEVTRAQYAAFDRNMAFDASTGDLPVTGISFEKAKAYCEWLGRRTGAAYRLPTAGEMRELLGRADAGSGPEITLDYWAGYALTPGDAREILGKAREMGPPASLLKPVGSGRAVDLAPLRADGQGREAALLAYDLDGNAAEWVAEGASGKALGGCAIGPGDRRPPRPAPPPELTGLRVVLERP